MPFFASGRIDILIENFCLAYSFVKPPFRAVAINTTEGLEEVKVHVEARHMYKQSLVEGALNKWFEAMFTFCMADSKSPRKYQTQATR